MRDLDKALADIVAIRTQIARDTAFRGLGSATLAATGVLALGTAALQAWWLGDPTAWPFAYFGTWIVTALFAVALIATEAVRRARKLHQGLAEAMVASAIESFLPSAGAGACLALVVARFAPDQVWLLPGLWQVLTGLGIFAAARILPRPVQFVAAWYLLAGLAGIALASEAQALSPWLMGLPFAVGQCWLALIMHRAMRDHARMGSGGSDGDR